MTLLRVVSFNSSSLSISNLSVSFSNSAICDSILAETITFEDFANLKSEAECREAGKLRLEGKDYVVKDGDVFHFLFNV